MSDDTLGALSTQGATCTVEHVREYPVKTPVLWDALTVPDQISLWMRTTSTILEPTVGGNFHYVWSPTSDSKGTVMIFDVRKTLAFTWHEETAHSIVRFDLSGTGDATTLTLHHRDVPPDKIPSIAAGWHAHLELLGAVLAHEPFEFDARFDDLLAQYQARASTL